MLKVENELFASLAPVKWGVHEKDDALKRRSGGARVEDAYCGNTRWNRERSTLVFTLLSVRYQFCGVWHCG